jgi:hypothetical protein
VILSDNAILIPAGFSSGQIVGLAQGISVGHLLGRSDTEDDAYSDGFYDGQYVRSILGTLISDSVIDQSLGIKIGYELGLSIDQSVDEDDGFNRGFKVGLSSAPTSSTSPPGLTSLSPPDGALLSVDPRVARFVPITATMTCPVGQVPYVFVKIGSLNWTIYDGATAQISPLFGDHTTVADQGGGTFAISVLPNGGWWRSGIEIKFVSGQEFV